MKYLILTTLLFISLISTTKAQDKPAYQLFKNNGKTANYNKMIKDLADSDMVFFGEYHYNPISHWMQLEVSKSLFEIKGNSLFFGAEMLESGNQLVLNEYLSELYPESKMIPEMTQMWNNYSTDYRPLVEFAKENKLRFIATNIPRRYASLISKKGISALKDLSPEALALIGPDLETYFDPTVKAYAEMADNMGGHVPPNMLNIQTAQAAKDATMAHFSLKNFKKGDLLLHIEGSYHSNYEQGIIWWVHKIKPGLTLKSITTVTASEWNKLTKEQKATIANYIIVVADNMTQTEN
ncbi:ChaN family lipoprotein [Polaribacter undariae]|uniref:ChaN family lipoprotein n=1 Tax=Polaribacter sejongensis TaxID=985043 RepID=A0AAJ1QX89_9FLAO|nr:ChaN family lipoprotein [Polaribacter undariae]MDN3619755.1 ChaN family lipoprotein [Polaribacter undariae]UWD31521.1 ChaN family lipoprotein [Polaribacter undariae]